MNNSIENLLLLNLKNQQIKAFDDAKRLFHGRGGSVPALDFINLDWLCGVYLLTLYRDELNFSVENLLKLLEARWPNRASALVAQHRYQKPARFQIIQGSVEQPHIVTENGLKYAVYFEQSLHTGFFLDMANARQWVRQHAQGKKVLNLFAHTCAFSVAAHAGGAASIVNIDMSKRALARGRENHRLNELEAQQVYFFSHDIFRSWGKLKRYGPYDLVIIDPPSYQPGSFVVEKDYARVLSRLRLLTQDRADVLACLNSPSLSSDFLLACFEEHAPEFAFQQRLDNPSAFIDLESERALKSLHFNRAR